MNKRSYLYSFLIVFSSIVWSTNGQTQAFYEVIGQIESIQSNTMKISDRVYRISPTVKVILKNKKSGKISDLASNTFVGINLITINNQALIDTIYVLPKPN